MASNLDPRARQMLIRWADALALPREFPLGVVWGESRFDPYAVGDAGRAFGLLQMRADVWGWPGAQWQGVDGLERAIAAITPQWRRAVRPLLYEYRVLGWPLQVEAFARFWQSAQRANVDAVNRQAEGALRAGIEALAGEGTGAMVTKPAIQYRDAHRDNYAVGRPWNGRTIAPEAWVLHIAQGHFEAITSWLATGPADRTPPEPSSAHFSVAKDGRIRQHVSPINTAFANGIIQAGATARLVEENRGINPNLWTIACEHEGQSGEAPTEAMFTASTHLCAWSFQEYLIPGGASGVAVDRDHIIRHADISPRDRAGCPGWPESVIRDYIARVGQLLKEPVEPPAVDYRARLIAEYQGWIAAATDDATRAAVRIEDARRKLSELGA